MQILISTSKTNAALTLIQNGKEIDKLEWENDYNLSRFLLINLDKMFKKHNFSLSDIEKFELVPQKDAGFTTSRIAETTVKMLNFAKNYEKN
ncbi:MAG: hypothetical protein V1698_00220 [bacterium]